MIRRSIAGIWWLHPAVLFAAIGVPISVAAYSIPESVYRTYWRTPKFFNLYALEITLACVAVFVFGAALSSLYYGRVAPVEPDGSSSNFPSGILVGLFQLSFVLCLIGYAIWAGLAVSRGMSLQDVIDIAAGQEGAMYEARYVYLPTVGGITTLTEFGTASMILGTILGFRRGWRGVRGKLGVVLALAAFRALVNSERFALIELVVPFFVTALAFRYLGTSRVSQRTRLMIKLAPLAGLLSLLTLFTGFEYFRSWSNYYEGRNLSLWEFGASRLTGYYVTSFNNGAYLQDRVDPLDAPYFTLHFLWNFPLSSPVVRRLFPNPLLESTDKWFYFPFLESEANLEFNNADGVMFPLIDYGVAGGLIYWFIVGIGCGLLYELYRRRRPLGLMLYPLVYLGLMEVPLALYWGEGRALPSQCLLLGAPLLFWILRRQFPDPMRPVPISGVSLEAS